MQTQRGEWTRPSQGTVDAVCTWGRWGEGDERGALNLLSADSGGRGRRLVSSGETVTSACL